MFINWEIICKWVDCLKELEVLEVSGGIDCWGKKEGFMFWWELGKL